MTTHRAPLRGDKFTAVAPCCGIPLRDLPAGDGLVPDSDTPTCGLPVVDTQGDTMSPPVPRAA